jgi:HPt (histidine-containing phosphotransfer) domain-containing protein
MIAAFRAIAEDTGDEFRNIVNLYLESTAEAMDRLRAAVAARLEDGSTRAAHTCAGSSRLCGVRQLALLFERIEAAARSGQFDLASALCARALTEFAHVRAALVEQSETVE